MLYTITLTIGHKVGADERWDTPTVASAVTTMLGVEAFTAIPCFGMWRGQAESSTRIEIVVDGADEARAIADEVPFLAQMLEQEAIMCEVRPSHTEFVSAAPVAAARVA